MMEVENLNKRRADRAGDSRLWSPLECLEDLVSKIKSGEVKPSQLAVHFFEERDNGGKTHRFTVSGVTFPEHIALLNIALCRTIEEWRESD